MKKAAVAGFTTPPRSGEWPRPPRVLLVDDDPIVLRALGRLLTSVRTDWTFDMVETSEAAARLVARESYDVVVIDLQIRGATACGYSGTWRRHTLAPGGWSIPVTSARWSRKLAKWRTVSCESLRPSKSWFSRWSGP